MVEGSSGSDASAIEDLVVPIDQPINDFGGPFPVPVLTEILLDIFDLKRTLVKGVLPNVILRMTLGPHQDNPLAGGCHHTLSGLMPRNGDVLSW